MIQSDDLLAAKRGNERDNKKKLNKMKKKEKEKKKKQRETKFVLLISPVTTTLRISFVSSAIPLRHVSRFSKAFSQTVEAGAG